MRPSLPACRRVRRHDYFPQLLQLEDRVAVSDAILGAAIGTGLLGLSSSSAKTALIQQRPVPNDEWKRTSSRASWEASAAGPAEHSLDAPRWLPGVDLGIPGIDSVSTFGEAGFASVRGTPQGFGDALDGLGTLAATAALAENGGIPVFGRQVANTELHPAPAPMSEPAAALSPDVARQTSLESLTDEPAPNPFLRNLAPSPAVFPQSQSAHPPLPSVNQTGQVDEQASLDTPRSPPGAPTLLVTATSPRNGARNVCIDTPLLISFDRPPTIGHSGVIDVHNVDGSLADRIDLADPSSFKRFIGGAQAGGVPYAFNYYPILVTGNTAAIYLHHTLDYGQTYYVTMDAGVFTDSDGNQFPGISNPKRFHFTTKSAAPAAGTREITVAADGSGDFCTVQGAIDFVPQNNTQRAVITVRPGTYNEIVYVRSNKPFVTVYGGDREHTIIQYANNNNFNGAVSGNFRTMFGVDASDFVLANITLHNTTPHGGSQAEAFRGGNQRLFLNHVNLISFQDTLLLSGKGFVNDSFIQGDVDFMWGTGTVFFQDCELQAVTSNGYYTQIRNPQGVHGNVYVHCRLTRADESVTGSYLARIDPNVFPYSQVVYIDSAMGPHIRPVGWLLNNATEAPNVQFWEYHSTDLEGNPLDISQRAPFSRQLTDAEASQWRDPAFVLGGWVPDLTPPTFVSLTASPNVLLPANNRMVPVTIMAGVTDAGDPMPRTRIISVTSNLPSHAVRDWVITGDLTVALRAQRGPRGQARVYTITVESRDASGNTSRDTVKVVVPPRR